VALVAVFMVLGLGILAFSISGLIRPSVTCGGRTMSPNDTCCGSQIMQPGDACIQFGAGGELSYDQVQGNQHRQAGLGTALGGAMVALGLLWIALRAVTTLRGRGLNTGG
jgi:hypothetical protein